MELIFKINVLFYYYTNQKKKKNNNVLIVAQSFLINLNVIYHFIYSVNLHLFCIWYYKNKYKKFINYNITIINTTHTHTHTFK